MRSQFNIGILLALLIIIGGHNTKAQNVLTPEELLQLKSTRMVQMHPDGSKLIYAIYTPRTPNEMPGGSHITYMLADLETNQSRPLFDDNIKGSSPLWSPDGKHLAFKMRSNVAYQLFVLPQDEETPIQVTSESNGVNSFKWNPDGKGFAYLSTSSYSSKEKELKKRGYNFIFF